MSNNLLQESQIVIRRDLDPRAGSERSVEFVIRRCDGKPLGLEPIRYADVSGSPVIEWYLTAPSADICVDVSLQLGDTTPTLDGLSVQYPLQLGLGKMPKHPYWLLRGSLVVALDQAREDALAAIQSLWPTPIEVDDIHSMFFFLEPTGLHLQGTLPSEFYPKEPEPVTLRVPQVELNGDDDPQREMWVLTAHDFYRRRDNDYEKSLNAIEFVTQWGRRFEQFALPQSDGSGERRLRRTFLDNVSTIEDQECRVEIQKSTDGVASWVGKQLNTRLVIGGGAIAEANFFPQLLTGQIGNSDDSWIRFSSKQSRPDGDVTPLMSLTLTNNADGGKSESALPESLNLQVLANPATTVEPSVSVLSEEIPETYRNWLCTTNGWLSFDTSKRQTELDPDQIKPNAIRETIEFSKLVQALTLSNTNRNRFDTFGLEVQLVDRQAKVQGGELKNQWVAVSLKPDPASEQLSLEVEDPMTLIITPPLWFKDVIPDSTNPNNTIPPAKPTTIPSLVAYYPSELETRAQGPDDQPSEEPSELIEPIPLPDPEILLQQRLTSITFVSENVVQANDTHGIPLTTQLINEDEDGTFKLQFRYGHMGTTPSPIIIYQKDWIEGGALPTEPAQLKELFHEAQIPLSENFVSVEEGDDDVVVVDRILRQSYRVKKIGESPEQLLAICFEPMQHMIHWEQPSNRPLVQTFPISQNADFRGFFDVNRGLLPYAPPYHTDDHNDLMTLVFLAGSLPEFSVNDTQNPIKEKELLTHLLTTPYFLPTLPGVEFGMKDDDQHWIYRHSIPALDEAYAEVQEAPPEGEETTTPGRVDGRDFTRIVGTEAFAKDAKQAHGWLHKTATNDEGRVAISIEEVKLDGRNPYITIQFPDIAVPDGASTNNRITFERHETKSSNRSGLSWPLTVDVPNGNNDPLPEFAVALADPDIPDEEKPYTIANNGQPLLAKRYGDTGLVTLDGGGLIQSEPYHNRSRYRYLSNGDKREYERLTDSLQLDDNWELGVVGIPIENASPSPDTDWYQQSWFFRDKDTDGWPFLAAFPFYPLRLSKLDLSENPSTIEIEGIWLYKLPDGDALPTDFANETITLTFTTNDPNPKVGWKLKSVKGKLDWRFPLPEEDPRDRVPRLIRVQANIVDAESAQAPYDLEIIELVIDSPVGLQQLPLENKNVMGRISPDGLHLFGKEGNLSAPILGVKDFEGNFEHKLRYELAPITIAFCEDNDSPCEAPAFDPFHFSWEIPLPKSASSTTETTALDEETDKRAWRVPGSPNQLVKTTLAFNWATAARHEFGFYYVDDVEGTIEELVPGGDGYAHAALTGRRLIAERGIFDQPNIPVGSNKEQIGSEKRTIYLQGGRYIAAYLIQDSITSKWLTSRESGGANQPKAFFTFDAANPDDEKRVRVPSSGDHKFTLEWEDSETVGVGDDYNDLIVTVAFEDSVTVEDPDLAFQLAYRSPKSGDNLNDDDDAIWELSLGTQDKNQDNTFVRAILKSRQIGIGKRLLTAITRSTPPTAEQELPVLRRVGNALGFVATESDRFELKQLALDLQYRLQSADDDKPRLLARLQHDMTASQEPIFSLTGQFGLQNAVHLADEAENRTSEHRTTFYMDRANISFEAMRRILSTSSFIIGPDEDQIIPTLAEHQVTIKKEDEIEKSFTWQSPQSLHLTSLGRVVQQFLSEPQQPFRPVEAIWFDKNVTVPMHGYDEEGEGPPAGTAERKYFDHNKKALWRIRAYLKQNPTNRITVTGYTRAGDENIAKGRAEEIIKQINKGADGDYSSQINDPQICTDKIDYVATVVLENVTPLTRTLWFKPDPNQIIPLSSDCHDSALTEIVNLLDGNDQYHVHLTSHYKKNLIEDEEPDEDENIARARAEHVQAALEGRGIAAERITIYEDNSNNLGSYVEVRVAENVLPDVLGDTVSRLAIAASSVFWLRPSDPLGEQGRETDLENEFLGLSLRARPIGLHLHQVAMDSELAVSHVIRVPFFSFNTTDIGEHLQQALRIHMTKADGEVNRIYHTVGDQYPILPPTDNEGTSRIAFFKRTPKADWLSATHLGNQLTPEDREGHVSVDLLPAFLRNGQLGNMLPQQLGDWSKLLEQNVNGTDIYLAAATLVTPYAIKQGSPSGVSLFRQAALLEYPFEVVVQNQKEEGGADGEQQKKSTNVQLITFSNGRFQRITEAWLEGVENDEGKITAWGRERLQARQRSEAAIILKNFGFEDDIIFIPRPAERQQRDLPYIPNWNLSLPAYTTADSELDPRVRRPQLNEDMQVIVKPQANTTLGLLLFEASPQIPSTPNRPQVAATRFRLAPTWADDENRQGEFLGKLRPARATIPETGNDPNQHLAVTKRENVLFEQQESAGFPRVNPRAIADPVPGALPPEKIEAEALDPVESNGANGDMSQDDIPPDEIEAEMPDAEEEDMSQDELPYSIFPPLVDVVAWATRPGEMTSTYWSMQQFEFETALDNPVLNLSMGQQTAVSLRRPRAVAGSDEAVRLQPDTNASRKLMGNRFYFAKLTLTQVLGKTALPTEPNEDEGEHLYGVLTTNSAFYTSAQTDTDAAIDPAFLFYQKQEEAPGNGDVYKLETMQLHLLSHGKFETQNFEDEIQTGKTVLIWIQNPSETAGLKVLVDDVPALPEDANAGTASGNPDWKWVKIDNTKSVYTLIGANETKDAPTTLANLIHKQAEEHVRDNIGNPANLTAYLMLVKFNRDDEAAEWEMGDTVMAIHLAFLDRGSAIVAPKMSVTLLAVPNKEPAQQADDTIKMAGYGRLNDDNFSPVEYEEGAREQEEDPIEWVRRAGLKTINRIQPADFSGAGDPYQYDVVVYGPGGELIPTDQPMLPPNS